MFVKERRDVGLRFMRAYLRGVRFYNGALSNGKLAGPNANEVIAIITETTPIKDAALLRTITPSGVDPNGRVNARRLQHDLDFYREHGDVPPTITTTESDIVDNSFVEAALKTLGRYRP